MVPPITSTGSGTDIIRKVFPTDLKNRLSLVKKSHVILKANVSLFPNSVPLVQADDKRIKHRE